MHLQAQYVSCKRWYFTLLQLMHTSKPTNLDYKKECQVPFGAYVQAHTQPTYTNHNAPHTLDDIYLRPAKSLQGGHELMDLTSHLVITQENVTEIPVTDIVIKAVEKMGYNQGFPTTGLKFTN